MGLNAMQERFCQEYAADARSNATRAAIVAGYSEKTAYSQASRLLKSVEVKARVRELRQCALEASGYDKETLRVAVMRELVRIGFSDITDVVQISPSSQDPNRKDVLDALASLSGGQRILDFGELLIAPTPNLSADTTAAIKSIKCKTDKDGQITGIDVDMHDKIQALRLLAEPAGITKGESTEVNINIGDELENARRRARGVMTEADATEAGDGDG